MACRRKTKGERELDFEDEESCEIQYVKKLLGKDEQMNIEEINGAIKEIADNFKNPSQQLKLIEELGELSRELSKDIAVGRNISTATISEIVDVAILIEQILYLAGEESAELAREQLEYKLQRTLKRIEEGYYK